MAKGPQTVCKEAQRRHQRDSDGLCLRLGIERTHKRSEQDQVHQQCADADNEEASGLMAGPSAAGSERPMPVGGEIHKERHGKGDHSGDQVMGVSLVEREREDAQVDDVTGGADHREPGHLTQPMRRREHMPQLRPCAISPRAWVHAAAVQNSRAKPSSATGVTGPMAEARPTAPPYNGSPRR